MMDLLGWGEWGLIALLAFIIIGPKDLPRVLYHIGQWVKKLGQATQGIREEFDILMRLEHLKASREDSDTQPAPSTDDQPTKRRRTHNKRPPSQRRNPVKRPVKRRMKKTP
jgi:Sec-independent protein translocase protein TatA